MRFGLLADSVWLERHLLGIILLAGLINGLLFTFLVPPWQHYDEPGHFEYAWLIANRDGLPEVDEYDQGTRREVAASMIEHDFFEGAPPNLLSVTEPIWIGISQTEDPPIYYWLVALPLRLVRTSDITFQLYIGRLVSLMLHLVTLRAAYGIVAALTCPQSPFRWAVPAALALHPGFADLMTAINNDVGATALFSLFLWFSVRAVRSAFPWLNLAGAGVLAALCFFTKDTVLIAVPLLSIPIVLVIFRGRQRIQYFLLGGVLVMGLVAASIMLTWNGAAAWYRKNPAATFEQIRRPEAPLGFHAMRLINADWDNSQSTVVQAVPYVQVADFQGEIITLGAWIWASQPVEMSALMLRDGIETHHSVFSIGVEPTFYAFSAVVSEDANQLMILLESYADLETGQVTVYYDGLVLVRGDYSTQGEPQFDNAEAHQGVWGEQPFTNLVRNASFERTWFQVRAGIERRIWYILPLHPSVFLTSLSDLAGSGWYFRATFENLLRTFWARFGWGHVTLVGQRSYLILGLVTAVGLLGAAWKLWEKRKEIDWGGVSLLIASLILVWGATASRGVDSLIGMVFIPAARYAYPVMIPTLMVLCVGWWGALHQLGRWVRISKKGQIGVFLSLLVLLDVVSLYSIVQYYGVF